MQTEVQVFIFFLKIEGRDVCGISLPFTYLRLKSNAVISRVWMTKSDQHGEKGYIYLLLPVPVRKTRKNSQSNRQKQAILKSAPQF